MVTEKLLRNSMFFVKAIGAKCLEYFLSWYAHVPLCDKGKKYFFLENFTDTVNGGFLMYQGNIIIF